MQEQKQVLIRDLTWGEIEVQVGEETRRFRDCKLWPGGARGWDWNETGTDHATGIQVADIQEVIEHGAQVVILTRGQQGRLQIQEETLNFLEEKGVTYHVEKTNQAVELFNTLSRRGERVGGLFHSTC